MGFNFKKTMQKNLFKNAKPFLKWAGGKTQLLPQLIKYFPSELTSGKLTQYYEPFVGGGAVFFYIKQNFSLKKHVISDINEELILTYKVIQNDVQNLTLYLQDFSERYYALNNEEQRSIFYYDIRKEFNRSKHGFDFDSYSKNWILRAAQLILLNKTCFNGLFRLNKQGEFNVPFGKYKSPKICDIENLVHVSELLQDTDIIRLDFEEILNLDKHNFFIYFDPPYRPLSSTASFTSYSSVQFTDSDQIRLANTFKELAKNGNKLMLSNADPHNTDPEDTFFELLYNLFTIRKVTANRMINCKGEKRGLINELVITNY